MTKEESLKVTLEVSKDMIEKILEVDIDYIILEKPNEPQVEVLKYLSDLLVLGRSERLDKNISNYLANIYPSNQSIEAIKESFPDSEADPECLFKEWIRLTQTIFCEIKYRYPRFIKGYNLYENLHWKVEENVQWGDSNSSSCNLCPCCLRLRR